MDALGNIQSVILPAPKVQAAAVLPDNSANAGPSIQLGGTTAADVDLQAGAVEARRVEILRNAARNAPQPLGSQVFTMFKDNTGQMITRFRDQNTGKVTYIPEPDLLNMTRASAADSLVNINI
jgi:hypothetical protein